MCNHQVAAGPADRQGTQPGFGPVQQRGLQVLACGHDLIDRRVFIQGDPVACKRLFPAVDIRLHRTDLPGSPDLVFTSRRTVIFVHGCFWHRHEGCRRTTVPNTRREFWLTKFVKNQSRDKKAIAELRNLSWYVEVVWECETRDVESLRRRLSRHSPSRRPSSVCFNQFGP